jgi:hypothetical protein
MIKVAIRTSDRNQFRRCRVAWNYGSPLREGMRRVSGIETRHLDFGSALHAGLEIYYDYGRQPLPTTPQEQVNHLKNALEWEAIIAYRNYMIEWRKQLIAAERYHLAAQEEWEGLNQLGESMLNRYFEWAEVEYRDYEVAYSEIEFEVPIPVHGQLLRNVVNHPSINLNAFKGEWIVRDTTKSQDKFLIKGQDNLVDSLDPNTYYLCVYQLHPVGWQLVTYQGRIDLILRHKKSGRYWVVDHKSTQRFDPLTDWIDIDPQASAYYWAVKRALGVDVEGVIFNYLKKAAPEPPKLIRKGKALSQDLSQSTTKVLYLTAIKQCGFNPMDYAEFLAKYEEPEYFRSKKTYRTGDELNRIEEFIAKEAIDMLNEPMIYPNPSQFNCNGCAFKDPCHIIHSGGDDMWFLKESGAYVYNAERAIK